MLCAVDQLYLVGSFKIHSFLLIFPEFVPFVFIPFPLYIRVTTVSPLSSFKDAANEFLNPAEKKGQCVYF